MISTDTQMLIDLQKRQTRHLTHILLSLLFFPWLVVYLLSWLLNVNHNQKLDKKMTRMIEQQAQRELAEGAGDE